MTFGAGRRVCLGEALAKNRLFLFATALVQSFEFQRAPDETNTKPQQLPKMDPRTYEMGLVLHPQHYQLIALARY